MTETNWKVRLYLFVRAIDNTPENRQTVAGIFAHNGSGESVANESKLFDGAIHLSITGNAPAQVYGIGTAVLLPDMRDDMRAFLDALPQARYYAVANTELVNFFAGELIEDNKVDAGEDTLVGAAPWNALPFTWQDALDDLFAERGLRVIPG